MNIDYIYICIHFFFFAISITKCYFIIMIHEYNKTFKLKLKIYKNDSASLYFFWLPPYIILHVLLFFLSRLVFFNCLNIYIIQTTYIFIIYNYFFRHTIYMCCLTNFPKCHIPLSCLNVRQE